jgi:hypothetical protein
MVLPVKLQGFFDHPALNVGMETCVPCFFQQGERSLNGCFYVVHVHLTVFRKFPLVAAGGPVCMDVAL